MTRFVVDCETLLRIAAGEIEVAAEHQLVAPTLVRSQALSALYESARRGDISEAEGIERVTRINSLKVRFLGDKVLQRQAWNRGHRALRGAFFNLGATVLKLSNVIEQGSLGDKGGGRHPVTGPEANALIVVIGLSAHREIV